VGVGILRDAVLEVSRRGRPRYRDAERFLAAGGLFFCRKLNLAETVGVEGHVCGARTTRKRVPPSRERGRILLEKPTKREEKQAPRNQPPLTCCEETRVTELSTTGAGKHRQQIGWKASVAFDPRFEVCWHSERFLRHRPASGRQRGDRRRGTYPRRQIGASSIWEMC